MILALFPLGAFPGLTRFARRRYAPDAPYGPEIAFDYYLESAVGQRCVASGTPPSLPFTLELFFKGRIYEHTHDRHSGVPVRQQRTNDDCDRTQSDHRKKES